MKHIHHHVLFRVGIQTTFTALFGIAAKHALSIGVSPFAFSWQVLLTAACYIFVLILLRQPQDIVLPSRQALGYIIITAVLSAGVSFALSFTGLQTTTAINYSFLSQTIVFFTTVLAFLFLGEHLRPYKMALIAALLVGVYLVATSGARLIPHSGDLLILAGALTFSIGMLFAKIGLRDVKPLVFTMYRALFGSLSIILGLAVLGQLQLDVVRWLVLATGVLVAASSFATFHIIKLTNASYMSMMFVITPVITAVFAYLLLGETMTWLQVLGGAIIVVSGFLIHKKGV